VKTPTRGLFICPHCGISRAYAYRRIRRFFVFLYLPVVPLAGLKEFVQCGFCRRAFKPSILGSRASTEVVDAETEAEPRRVNPPPRPDPDLVGAAASTLLVWEGDGGDVTAR